MSDRTRLERDSLPTSGHGGDPKGGKKSLTGAEHSSHVSVSLVETSLYYCLNKRRAMKEHSLVVMVIVLFSYLQSPPLIFIS